MFSIERISQLQGRISDIQTKLTLPELPGLSFDKHLEAAIQKSEATVEPQPTKVAPASTQSAQPTQPQTTKNVFNITVRNADARGINPESLADVVSVDPETNRLTIDLEKLKAISNQTSAVESEEEVPSTGDLPISNHSIDELIRSSAEKYGVDPRLVAAIAEAESAGDQSAISSTGAIGVMQLMPGTAAALGVNPYDRAENIDGGAKYISQMLTTFNGDIKRAVAAYNAGPGAVQRYGGIPPYSETQNYVRRVIDLYE